MELAPEVPGEEAPDDETQVAENLGDDAEAPQASEEEDVTSN